MLIIANFNGNIKKVGPEVSIHSINMFIYERDHGKMIQNVITLIIKWLNSLHYIEAIVFHHWLTINGLPSIL